MIEKGKISSVQMAMLMNPTIAATSILSAPAILAKQAGRDMWLSPIGGSLFGILAVYIACRLNKLYPSESIVQYSERIVGKAAGKLLGFVILFMILHLNGIIIREYGEFIVSSFLTDTPIIVVSFSMVILCAFTVRGGLEVLARSAQIIVPVVVLLFIGIVALLIPDLKPQNMLPIMERGIGPSLLGAIVTSGWFSEYGLIMFLLPNVANTQKAMKWGMISVIGVFILLFLAVISSLMLFGTIAGSFPYPVLIGARYISIADFLEHVESIVMAIWVAAFFLKITVFYYILSLGTAQWLKLSDYRPIVFPLGFLLIVFSLWSGKSLQELNQFLSTIFPFYIIPVFIIAPLLLLLIALLRNKSLKQQGGKKSE